MYHDVKNFLKENQKFTKINQQILENFNLIRPVFKSLKKEEKSFLLNLKEKVENFKNIEEEEIKTLLNLRNQYVYSKHNTFKIKSSDEEARDVILDSRVVFVRHLKNILFKLRNLYRLNNNEFSEQELSFLSLFKNLNESNIDFKNSFDLIKLAFKKDLEFDLSKQDLLDLFSHLDDLQIINLESFSLRQYDFNKYKRILEIRNRNISYLN